ncbi:hypothetical protein ES332_D10G073600v1 [Gossypium tomentosum]|uniref:Uncharacterized protein n=1 Tax=Gossypium tomentosum TaxID=34277 RepID=A0A5D2J1T7_GOSTO|nr:hypothetical protein ES332_D10G073600v1 [Gossypium tomentosum]
MGRSSDFRSLNRNKLEEQGQYGMVKAINYHICCLGSGMKDMLVHFPLISRWTTKKSDTLTTLMRKATPNRPCNNIRKCRRKMSSSRLDSKSMPKKKSEGAQNTSR